MERTARTDGSGPVIICYDGSKGALQALTTTAALMRGAPAVVVTVWKPINEALLVASVSATPPIADLAEVDERQRRAAEDLAQDAARRASDAGMKAEPLAIQGKGAVWEAIERVARERDARLISCGTHGRTRARLRMLGGVASDLVHNSTRPVMVVPTPEVVQVRQSRV